MACFFHTEFATVPSRRWTGRRRRAASSTGVGERGLGLGSPLRRLLRCWRGKERKIRCLFFFACAGWIVLASCWQTEAVHTGITWVRGCSATMFCLAARRMRCLLCLARAHRVGLPFASLTGMGFERQPVGPEGYFPEADAAWAIPPFLHTHDHTQVRPSARALPCAPAVRTEIFAAFQQHNLPAGTTRFGKTRVPLTCDVLLGA